MTLLLAFGLLVSSCSDTIDRKGFDFPDASIDAWEVDNDAAVAPPKEDKPSPASRRNLD